MINKIKYQYPAILWTFVVLVLCNIPPVGAGGNSFFFQGVDKMAHLVFFFILSVLLLYGKIKEQNSYDYRLMTIVKILAITVVLGGGIEILQWKVFTYRSAEWWDFIADMLGTCMAVFSYLLLHRGYEKVKAL